MQSADDWAAENAVTRSDRPGFEGNGDCRMLIRKYLKRHWAPALVVLAIICYGISRSSSFQTQAHHEQYAAYQKDQEGPLAFKWFWRNAKVLVRCAADFNDANHGPLTAIGTIIFTTTLWWATRTLVRHAPQIERAYISAGGWRRFFQATITIPTATRCGRRIEKWAAYVANLVQPKLVQNRTEPRS